MYKCDWKNLYKTDNFVHQHLRESSRYKKPLRKEKLLENNKNRNLFDYVQCEIEVPEKLWENLPVFPPILKNINDDRGEIGPLMEDYVEKKGLLTHPTRMLKSSCFMEIGKIITPLMLYYLKVGAALPKIYSFVQHTLIRCFSNILQSAANVRGDKLENPCSRVVAEAIELPANRFYVYQLKGWNQYTVTNYLSEGKAFRAINNKMFERMGFIRKDLHEVQLVNLHFEINEPTFVGFLIQQLGKQSAKVPS